MRYPITHQGYLKKRDFGSFQVDSFRWINSYLIGLNEQRSPTIDLAPYFPKPRFEEIHNEILRGLGAWTGLMLPWNRLTGEQPPKFRNGRYLMNELYFQLDENRNALAIAELRQLKNGWARCEYLAKHFKDQLLEVGKPHVLTTPQGDWHERTRLIFPRLVNYLDRLPMEIKAVYILGYAPGDTVPMHRDRVGMGNQYPYHACIFNFEGRPQPTYVYDTKLDVSVPCASWATAFNYCDYHGGHRRNTVAYTLRVDGWMDGIAGFEYGVPFWNEDWEYVKRVPNPNLQ